MPTLPAQQDNTAQIAYWNDRAAVTWTALQERLDAMFEPLTALALQAAKPAAGERVVEIGCGCGATTLALAQRVGPTGQILAVDVSEPMSARARERIAAAGLTNARVVVSDAATYVFPRPGADLLFSRFGVMFFADPTTAFANLHQAVRPGGRLLCAVWRALADNPWFRVPLEVARPLVSPQPPADPDAPGPFALANEERTRAICTAAGWRDVTLTSHEVPIRIAPAGQLQQATDFATRMGAVARILAGEGAEVQDRVRVALQQALKAYDGPDGVMFTGAIWLISARS